MTQRYSFLSDVSRIASKNYTPTPGVSALAPSILCVWNVYPDDILRARLQTIGVEEHRIVMETGTRFFDLPSPTCSYLLHRVGTWKRVADI